MTIKVQCDSCGGSFQAKDKLAGKKVKCPKCSQPLTIAAPQASAQQLSTKPQAGKLATQQPHNPLLSLLDEAEVKSAVTGPTCPSCYAELSAMAVVCVECGYNVETGQQLQTSIHDDDAGIADVGVTDADRLMAQAEREIDDMPVTATGQDFGDGAGALLLAGAAGLVLLALVLVGLGIIFGMDLVTEHYASWFVSFLASVTLATVMIIWITIVAFMQKPVHGIVCIATAGLWCVVFGFMQGKQLIVPTIILLISLLIGLASGGYSWSAGIKPL